MMEKKKIKPKSYSRKSVIVNDITTVAPDRNSKDVGFLRSAIEAAERVSLPNRYKLYDLYHDVLTIDGHLSGIVEKRTKAVTNKVLRFVDADGRLVDEVNHLIGSEKFGRLVELIMESVYFGVSGVEFLMGNDFDFLEIPRKHIRPEQGLIVKSQYDNSGTPLSELPFCWLIGRPGNLGRLLQCSMYALYKRGAFGDFAQYVEIFGQPVRVIKYDAYDRQTQEEIRRMISQQGASLVMMLPKQAGFEMLDGKTSNGTGELQERLIKCCNQEMSIAILGNSETTVSSASSGYAQAEVHAEQQYEVTKGDLKMVLQTLNCPHFFGILRSYGYSVDGGRFEFTREEDVARLSKRLDLDLRLADRVPVADDYWYETYRLPKPDNYDELIRLREERRQAALDAVHQAEKNGKKVSGSDGKKNNLFDALSGFFA